MDHSKPEPLLYGRKEAAQLLSISVRQLDYLIELGYLRVTRIGSRVLLRAKELERFAKGDWPVLTRRE